MPNLQIQMTREETEVKNKKNYIQFYIIKN